MEAINWASQQVINHNINQVLIESDSKVCIEVLQEPDSHIPWRISTIISNTLRLKALSHNTKFNSVLRDPNSAIYILAKLSLNNFLTVIFVLGSAPVFVDVILLEQKLKKKKKLQNFSTGVHGIVQPYLCVYYVQVHFWKYSVRNKSSMDLFKIIIGYILDAHNLI